MRHSSDGVAIDVLALGILRQGQSLVLVQQRAPAPRSPVWTIPGGLVEAGELITDALIREVQEEAGLTVTAIGPLACFSQIDRPQQAAQTIVLIFEVATWHGTWAHNDPDDLIVAVDLVPSAEAVRRLEANDGWPGVQAPLRAYVRGDAPAGLHYFYREGPTGPATQTLMLRLPT